MTHGASSGTRIGLGWQLILADLALILFLLLLTALPASETEIAAPRKTTKALTTPEIAPSQALYRPVTGGPSLANWLAAQPHDPRATLTVFARYRPSEEMQAWEAARAVSAQAARTGIAVRTIITAGEETDLYASLAYDAAVPQVGS